MDPSQVQIPEELTTAADELMPELIGMLSDHVRIPSVSADPNHVDDVNRSAEFVRRRLEDVGFPTTDILHLEGALPAVYADWPGPPGAPTVLLYAHHDVQPTGPMDGWTTQPFEPIIDGDRLYGRGAADDKAGIAMHIGALTLLAGRSDGLPVGIKVLIEGEEEVGSLHLEDFIETHSDDLRSDMIVIGDAGNWRPGRPALTTSLRGVVDLVLTVRVIESEVHSGLFGGAVPDALTVLSRLIATLHHPDGRVAVEGLEENESDPLDLHEDEVRQVAGMLDGVELIGRGTLTSRLWNQPAISVLAVDAPPVAEAVNALVASARAKISLRIAPGQDAASAMALLEGHLRDHTPWGAHIEIEPGSMGPPFSLSASGDLARATESSMAAAYGTPAIHMGVGGSIPFVASFAERFPAAEIVLTGVADSTSSIHGPNESVSLSDLRSAVLAEARALQLLGVGAD